MKWGIVALILMSFLCGCINDTKTPAPSVKVAGQPPTMTLDQRPVPARMLEVDDTPLNKELEHDLRNNLFGKFFNKHASFYIIKHPTNSLYDVPLNTVTLYYIDSVLCQTKYTLTKPIANQLINTYGRFGIIALDTVNLRLMKTEKIIKKEGENWVLNPHFTRYEMRWITGNKEILFRSDPEDISSPITYTERVPNYNMLFALAEERTR